MARIVPDWPAWVRFGRLGRACCVVVRYGRERHGRHGTSWLVRFWDGKVWQARYVLVGSVLQREAAYGSIG